MFNFVSKTSCICAIPFTLKYFTEGTLVWPAEWTRAGVHSGRCRTESGKQQQVPQNTWVDLPLRVLSWKQMKKPLLKKIKMKNNSLQPSPLWQIGGKKVLMDQYLPSYSPGNKTVWFKTEGMMNSCIILQQKELWMLFFHFLRKHK